MKRPQTIRSDWHAFVQSGALGVHVDAGIYVPLAAYSENEDTAGDEPMYLLTTPALRLTATLILEAI